MPRPMGRPSKYSPERVEAILTALRAGNTRRASAGYAGVAIDTLGAWIDRYPDFSASVEKAEADAEVGMVANIKKAVTDGTWTAAAWWLERRRHRDWGRVERIEHSGPEGQPVQVELALQRLSTEELIQLDDLARRATE